MKFFYWISLLVFGLASSAIAAEAPSAEQLKKVSGEYVNARNLSKYLADARDPIDALTQIAKVAGGSYANDLTKDFVAYESATGGRNLASSNNYNAYVDSDRVAKFADFYGQYGSNSENTGVPYTADDSLDMVDEYLPKLILQNPKLAEKIKGQGVTNTNDIKIDSRKLDELMQRTKLDPQTIKFIVKAMNTGQVVSPALIKSVPVVQAGSDEFVQANFPIELEEARRMRASADSHFAVYEQDMADYDKFIANMRAPKFREKFKEYAKHFKKEDREKAMAPYVAQAQARLDKAKASYDLGVKELNKLQLYLNNFHKQKLEPALKKQNQSSLRIGGIYSFAVAAVSSSSIDGASARNSFSSQAGGSSGNSSVSGSGNGFNVSAAKFGSGSRNSLSAQQDVGSALGSSFAGAYVENAEEDLSPVPTNARTRYQRPTSFVSGKNWQMITNGKDEAKTGTAGLVSKFSPSDTVDRLMNITPFATSIDSFFSTANLTDGKEKRANATDPSAFEMKESKNNTLESFFKAANDSTSQFITNNVGKLVLKKGDVNQDQQNQLAGLKTNGYDLSSLLLDITAVINGNEEYNKFNTKFPNDEEVANNQAVTNGDCQMLEDPEAGDFKVEPNPEYVNTYQPYEDPNFDNDAERRHVRYDLDTQDAKPARVVAISNPRHIFAPRDDPDWQDRENTLTQCQGGQMITDVCGLDKKESLNNIYAWEPRQQSRQTFKSSEKDSKKTRSLSIAAGKDFGYYYKPIVKYGGKILATTPRWTEYTTVSNATYQSCMYSTFGMGHQLCCDIAEYQGCQQATLPDVEPDNKLPLSYTKAHAQDDADKDLPHITTNGYDSYEYDGGEANGNSWFASLPPENFGFNGPWVKSTVIGEAGFGELKEQEIDKRDYAQYMLIAPPPNSGYSMSENNNMSKEAHNMSAGTIGWESYKNSQAKCARKSGVNCICDFDKNLFRKSDAGYAFDRVSGTGTVVDNKQRSEMVSSFIGDKEFKRAEDTTKRLNWSAQALASRDGYPINAGPNYNLGGKDDVKYPGPGSVKGLSNAQKGSTVVYQEPVGEELTDPDSVIGEFKRPWVTGVVDDIDPKNGCVSISSKNNPSVLADSWGNSENLGSETKSVICPPTYAASAFEYPDGQIPDCATNNEYYTCKETQQGWDSWTVMNPYGDAPLNAVGGAVGGAITSATQGAI